MLLTISDMSIVETEMEVDETSIPSVKVGQEARVRIDAYPNQTFNGLVTEVGGSPILPDGGRPVERHQVQGQGPDQGPAARHQARPLGAGRHPDRLPRAGARGPDPGAGRARPRAQAGRGAEAGRAARRGGRLPDGERQGRFQAIKTGLLGELSLEVVSGLKGGETLITGPFKALRTLKPGDPVKVEEKKKDGAKPS